MLIPINLTGPSSESRARFLSSQKTLNLYPEKIGSDFVLNSFPGLAEFSIGDGPCRGAFEHLNVLYQVSGENLYSIDTAGARTNLGSIPGSGRCIFDGIGTNVVIVTEGTVYYWNGTTAAEITDNDLETPNSCAHLNNQILYDGDGGRFASSDVSDATSIAGLNYGTAESDADDLVRVFVYDKVAWMMGDKTLEPWENTGTGNPPFSPILGAIIQVGLSALHSVAKNDSGFYFLGDDRRIYFVQGGQEINVTPVNLANVIEGFDTLDDAEGNCFQFQAQNFYVITFPTERRTFCFSESVGIENGWFDLSSGTSETERYIASSFVYFNRKTYVTDTSNGNIYELDKDTFDEFGEEILRIRDSASFHGGLVGKPGKLLSMSRFEVIMETGVGSFEQDEDDEGPFVSLLFSDDGGRTWSTEQMASAGRAGEFIWKVEWFGLGSFFNRIMRIKMSDAVYWCIHSAAADIEASV
jgi:hypothetical protein